ncbi:MAG: nitric oxide reductase transcriptional regulator NorR [Vicinamibacterales bacterium]
MLTNPQHAAVSLEVLLEIAHDLTASLAAADRYARLIAAVRRLIPCDAACLMRLDGADLVPMAGYGLTTAALSRRYPRREHPRLDVILSSREPVRFPPDSALPDPFDGAIEGAPAPLHKVHACMGVALTEGGEVVGALTADGLESHQFDAIDPRMVATLGALAGAALRTSALIEALEQRADHRSRVARELLRSAAQSSGGALLGSSAAVARLRREIALVAASDLAVLITGETGVGKELVAHHVHAASARRDEALIHVNCAALPLSIAESELFGHVAGAFTGATRDRAGKFEVADGGTLFLDEIGELSLEIQPKLLRVLQHGEIQRVGSDRAHRVNVRVIAATNRDLEREVAAGRFRADLYHRLAAFPLPVPPLRARREDTPVLAAHFADAAARRLGLAGVRFTDEARLQLLMNDWPGNVRELENVIGRGVLRASFGHDRSRVIELGAAHLDLRPRQADAPATTGTGAGRAGEPAESAAEAPLGDRLARFERDLILGAVQRNGGNWAAAARDLGLHRSNLHHRARRLGLKS